MPNQIDYMALAPYLDQFFNTLEQAAAYLWALAATESGHKLTIKHKTSGAYGLYQFLPTTWKALKMPAIETVGEGGQTKGLQLFIKKQLAELKKFPNSDISRAINSGNFRRKAIALYMMHHNGVKGAVTASNIGPESRKAFASFEKNLEKAIEKYNIDGSSNDQEIENKKKIAVDPALFDLQIGGTKIVKEEKSFFEKYGIWIAAAVGAYFFRDDIERAFKKK